MGKLRFARHGWAGQISLITEVLDSVRNAKESWKGSKTKTTRRPFHSLAIPSFPGEMVKTSLFAWSDGPIGQPHAQSGFRGDFAHAKQRDRPAPQPFGVGGSHGEAELEVLAVAEGVFQRCAAVVPARLGVGVDRDGFGVEHRAQAAALFEDVGQVRGQAVGEIDQGKSIRQGPHAGVRPPGSGRLGVDPGGGRRASR